MIINIGIELAKVLAVLIGVLNLAAILTWMERKQSAVMQDRIGANRATIFGFRMFGLFQILADGLKMFVKEDFVPAEGNRFLHGLAPFVAAFFALVGFAAIPFGSTVNLFGREIPLQIIDLNVGVLYIFAVMSLGIYGVVLAGWSSNNNYAFLGGMRGSSQMFSYEVTIGATILGVLMIFESMSLQEIVQGSGTIAVGHYSQVGRHGPTHWVAFSFLLPGIAETKRMPFDLARRRVRDHRILRRVQQHEVRFVHADRFRGDGAHFSSGDNTVLRWLAGTLPAAGWLSFPRRSVPRRASAASRTAADSILQRQGFFLLLVLAAGALDVAALPL